MIPTRASSPPPARDACIDTIARTIWAEARGEGRLGMAAVGCVIRNRADHPRWWGRDLVSVCRAPSQFSCWNADDPQRPRLLAVTAADAAFASALALAAAVVDRSQPDLTGGADSYANLAVCHPAWARGRVPTAVIGAHSFFALELRAGAPPAPVPAAVAAPEGSFETDALNAAELARIRAGRPRPPVLPAAPLASDADALNAAELDRIHRGE